ncbi:MAG: GGDEF domain-containing protein [Planctomycetaceae bacterium]|nr:GGDEF domain-containing protein [Planctomycetaceae bacterium]
MKHSALLDAIQTRDAGRRYVVPGETVLSRLPELVASQDVRYLLVESANGVIDGVVDLSHVRELLAVPNPVERARWEQLPASSIAEPLAAGNGAAQSANHSSSYAFELDDCHTIHDDAGIAAVVSNGVTYVNWNRVSGAIARTHVDPVTMLPLRLAFNRRIREEVERAARSQQPLAVLLIDLDHFKAVNDRYGHRVGDSVLRAVACSLRDGIRSYDFVARYGGDEFAILCSGCHPENIALPLKRLRESLAGRQSSTAAASGISLSIGAAVMHTVDTGCSPEILIEQADICLYRAKRGGRATAYVVELDPFGIAVSTPRESK